MNITKQVKKNFLVTFSRPKRPPSGGITINVVTKARATAQHFQMEME